MYSYPVYRAFTEVKDTNTPVQCANNTIASVMAQQKIEDQRHTYSLYDTLSSIVTTSKRNGEEKQLLQSTLDRLIPKP